jgi:hypothetical protein
VPQESFILKSKRLSRLIIFIAVAVLAALAACSAGPTTPSPSQPAPEAAPVQPVISSLTADHQVPLLGKTPVACEASEAGSDNLTYNWTATGGSITGAGPKVEWTAPDKAGDYMITVAVSDATGGSAQKNIVVNVPAKPNNPPVISAVKFTRPDHSPITVKTQMTDAEKAKLPELVIRKYETAEISCLASDADNDKLDYVWQATGGKIVGSGAGVQWIAAGEPGKYTVSVEVSDNNGGVATFQIPISVHCCSG